MSETEDMLSMSVRDFAAQTAAKTPTPGGGSVAGVVGAVAVGLGEMALNFTRGKKKFAAHKDLHSSVAKRLARARGMFEDLVCDDMAAYKYYQETTRMDDGPEKDEAVQLAVAEAINIPREMTKLALAVLGDLDELSDKCNPYLVSDLVASAALSVAVVRLSDYNVRINAPNLTDANEADEIRAASTGDLKKAAKLRDAIEAAVKQYLP